MSKNSVTKFDLEAAFKALDSVDYAASEKGLVARRQNLKESYSNLKENKSSMDILLEDYYDLESEEDLNAAADDRDGEVAKAKLTRIEKIVDLDAKTADELLPSYVGKVIIQCPQCMNLFYKNEEDIEKDPEDPTTCNVNEPCQHCGNISGYTLIGKVDAVDESETAELTGETEEEPDALDLDLDFDTEEEAPAEDEAEEDEEDEEEDDAEEAEEETDEDLDLDLNLESLNNSKLQKKCSDKTDLDTDNHSTNLTLNEELEDAVDESMNNSKLQKTCSEKTDLDTDNHSKNLTLNEELDDEDEEVNITVTEAKNDDTDYYRGFIEDACYFINDDGYFDIYGTDLTQKAQDIVDAFDAYIAKKKYGKAAKAGVTAKDLEVVNTKEGKRIQIPGTVVEECVNSEAPVETTEACTEPVKENVASVLAAFEASLDDDEDFTARGEFPEDESLNNNQKFKDISKKHCSENDSKNLTINESLNEAVAITISVDEVEDQVMATEPCDAMVVSAQPAGVAGYTPEAPDFFCDFNDAEEFVAPEAPVAEIAHVEAPVGVAPEIEAEIADAATAAIAPETTVEEPVEDEANNNEDDNDDNDDDNTPEAEGEADADTEDEEVEESLESVTKDTLKEFDDLNNQLYSELGIMEVTEDLETDAEKAIDELDELNAETAPAGAEEVADIDQDIADRDEVEDGAADKGAIASEDETEQAEKAEEALTEETAPKADSASFKQMLNSETFKEFNTESLEEDLDSEELEEGVFDAVKRKAGEAKAAIKNKSVASFAKALDGGKFTLSVNGKVVKQANDLKSATELALAMSNQAENNGKTIVVGCEIGNKKFNRVVQYLNGKVTLDKVQDVVKTVKADNKVNKLDQNADSEDDVTILDGEADNATDSQAQTAGENLPTDQKKKAIDIIKKKLKALGIDLKGNHDKATKMAIIELEAEFKDADTTKEELETKFQKVVDAFEAANGTVNNKNNVGEEPAQNNEEQADNKVNNAGGDDKLQQIMDMLAKILQSNLSPEAKEQKLDALEGKVDGANLPPAVVQKAEAAIANANDKLEVANPNDNVDQVDADNSTNSYTPTKEDIEALKGALIDADDADVAAVAKLIGNSDDAAMKERIFKLFADEMKRNSAVKTKNSVGEAKPVEDEANNDTNNSQLAITARDAEQKNEVTALNNSLTVDNYKRIVEALIADAKFVVEDLEECDETKIEECLNESLTAVYENVKNFTLVDCSIDDNKFIVEGLITFASGKTRETRYVFNEAYKLDENCKLIGTNKLLDSNGTFVLEGKLLSGNNLITESFSYKYHDGTELVEGLIRK